MGGRVLPDAGRSTCGPSSAASSAAPRRTPRTGIAETGPTAAPRPGEQRSRPRVAIAHDYLTQRGGAERVVLALMRAFPDAEVHTLLYDADGTFPEFRDARVVTSPLNRIAPLRRHHRAALPLLAAAASRMTVDADVTVVSTSGWAHGFDVRGRSVVYCHNPARWLYQGEDYLGGRSRSLAGLVLGALAPRLRRWDRAAMLGHDTYLVNATVVRERVRAAYDIDASVVFPPTASPRGGRSRSARSTRASTWWSHGCCPTRTSTRPSRRSARCPTNDCW